MSPGSRAVVGMQRNDITPDLLKRLARMRAPDDARMISTYLDLDPSVGLATETARRTAVTSVVDQARRMATAQEDGLSHAARMQLRADVARIEGLLTGRVIDDGLAEGAHAIAVFACQPTDLLEAVRLPRAVGERVMIARRPAIRPLIEIGPPPIWAVLLTDGDDARLLEGHGDRLEEVQRLRTRLPRRSGHGIWAPDHDDRAVGKDERRHLRRAVELLADHARGRRYDALAVGTSRRLWAVIEDELPAELRRRVLGRLDIDADESRPAEVRARVEPLLHATAQTRRRRVVELLSGPRAVHGPVVGAGCAAGAPRADAGRRSNGPTPRDGLPSVQLGDSAAWGVPDRRGAARARARPRRSRGRRGGRAGGGRRDPRRRAPDRGGRARRDPAPPAAGERMSTPPADAAIIALSLPLFMVAGAVSGTAFAMARAGSDLYYLVDDAAPGGPPVWIHEGLIEKSLVAPANVKRA